MNRNATTVLSYAMYMANMWSHEEAVKVFGKLLGEHIFGKWSGYYEDYGYNGASLKLIYELDSTNLELLVDRATLNYWGRRNINNNNEHYVVKTSNGKSYIYKHRSDGKNITASSCWHSLDDNDWHEATNGSTLVICDNNDIVDVRYATTAEILEFETHLKTR